MNYFAYPSAAERYATGRRYIHPLFVERIGKICGPEGGRFASALDVGCGTGRSTLALADLADKVTGVDISPAMLAHAPRHPRIEWIESPAESLPLPSGNVDLVTTGLAYHWFDQPRFLAEAHRVLKPDGWLAIYGDGFLGEMVDNPDYAAWHAAEYARRYPAPPRSARLLTEEDARRHGFDPIASERFIETLSFTPSQLADYFTTQSNVIAAVEGGSEDVGTVREWLLASISPLFGGEAALFGINCTLDIFRRAAAADSV